MSIIRRIMSHIGRRGASLIFWGFVFLVIGAGNIGNQPSPQLLQNLQYILRYVPLEVVNIGWVLSGLACWAAAWWKRLEDLAFGVAWFMPASYCLAYFAAWLWGDVERAWLGSILYFGIAIKVQVIAGWQESPHNRESARDGSS